MMSKLRSYYFRHDCNASEDDKIVRLLMKRGDAGYGLYWRIIETLSRADNYQMDCAYDEIAYMLRVKEEDVRSIVNDFGLFIVENGKFYSARLAKNMTDIVELLQKKSDAGKKGMVSRWGKQTDNTDKTELPKEDNSDISVLYQNNNKNITKENNKDTLGAPARESGDSSRFVRPTVSEVRAYCEERGNDIDPEEFVAFYESKGWWVGNAQMKNWKGAIIGWEKRREKKKEQQATSNGIRLGCEEWIDENGRRTYGTGKFTVPNDAPPRPSVKHVWVNSDRQWTIL